MSQLQHLSNTTISDNVYFEIARHSIPGYTPLLVFCENDSVTTSLETLWEEGGLYEYIDTPINIKISSTNAADTAAGTGAQSLLIAGLDENGDWKREILPLNGLTETISPTLWTAVNVVLVATVGTGKIAAGTIYVGVGVVGGGIPATVYSKINGTGDLDCRALQSPFVVPAGYRGIVKGLFVNTGKGKEAKVGIYNQRNSGPMCVIGKTFSFESSLFISFSIPPVLSPLSRIELRAREIGTSSGIEVVGGYTLILERIDSTRPFINPLTLATEDVWSGGAV